MTGLWSPVPPEWFPAEPWDLDRAPDPYGPDPYVFGPPPAGVRYVPEVIG